MELGSLVRRWAERLRGRPGEDGRLRLRELEPAGRNRLEAEIRRRVQYAYLGDHLALCRVLGRFTMYVDTRDRGHAPHLVMDGYWELWVTEFLARRVRRGMVAVDVGANLGYFTLVLADLVGEDGHVHAFEPNPPVAQLLSDSVRVNGFADRVTVHGEALGEADGGRFRLEVPEGYPGGAAVKPLGEGEEAGAPVAVRRLDGVPGLADADIVKIDAEGGEQAIWRGMAGLLARGRPLTVLLEFVAERYPDPAGFLAEIAGSGLSLNLLDPYGVLRPVTADAVLARPAREDAMLVLVR